MTIEWEDETLSKVKKLGHFSTFLKYPSFWPIWEKPQIKLNKSRFFVSHSLFHKAGQCTYCKKYENDKEYC